MTAPAGPRPARGTGTLLLLRHGESAANAADEFTGWLDVPLTARGRDEARNAGRLLAEHQLTPDVVHTSVLQRAIITAELVLEELGRTWTPVRRSWRLNERHYGALQGRAKTAVRAEVGFDNYVHWRRSYTGAPPPLDAQDASAARRDPRYRDLPDDALPATESLSDVVARLTPYWHDAIAHDIAAGRTTLVVAHGNSLRALVKHLDNLTPTAVEPLNLPTGIPLRYDLADWKPITSGGTYLDPITAAERIAQVAAQGGT